MIKLTADDAKEVSEDTVTAALHHSPLINHLLQRRGITTPEDAERFLKPNYDEHIHDPFLMLGMKEAVERVLQAIDNNEKVLIYSDFDADGIPGAVVLHDFFKEIGFENFTNYIPHRHDEGFGVHLDAIDQFEKDGVQLLITIDCGIADVDEVARAREHGIDVIITDHHEPNGKEPDTVATLDPKQKKCNYPFKELCGSGVIFKLVQGVLATRNFGVTEGREKWYLDMVGLATLSDMVPLVGENRVFASYGLKVLQR
ncbi:MAG: DHH family phosphoesterase, partial [Candidatus Paceibacterota bacterium]